MTVKYKTSTGWEECAFKNSAWGQIAGTLSDQGDLQTILNAKQSKITIATFEPSGGNDGDVWLQIEP